MIWDLIGRELDIRAAVDALGDHRVVALAGATGVGRSRLLAEIADRIDRPDHPVFRVIATAATRSVPLSPFIDLLPPTPTPDRSLLLGQVLDKLRARGGREGLLLAIDDAHHLDDASLALLALLEGQPDVAIALTVCTDHPSPPGLRAVTDGDGTVRFDVEPLSREDTTSLVAAALGPPEERLVDDLWRITQGNPLVLRTLLDGAVDNLMTNDSGRWTSTGPLTSRRLRDFARDRLQHLPDAVRPALELVALGSPIPYSVLAAAVDTAELAELHDADVVETVSSGDDLIVRPTHPLYGELYADHAGEARRRDAYRRLVGAAAAVPGAVDPLRVAAWQQRTGDAPDPALGLAGARAALGRHDGAVAESLILPVLDRIDGPQGLLTLGVARAQLGRCEDAESAFAEASDLATRDADIGEIASARAFNLAFGTGRVEDADEVLSKARDLIEDGVLRSRLDAERGVIAAIGGDFTLALEASRATIDNPDATGATLTSAYVSRTLADAMLGRCDGFASVVAAGRSAAAGCRTEMPFAHDQIGVMEANALVAAGEVDAADELAAGALSAPGASPLVAVPWLDTRVIACVMAGRLDDAAAIAAESIAYADNADPFALRTQAVALAGLVDAMRGLDPSEPDLEALRAEHPEPRAAVWLDRARAWATAARGDFSSAAHIAARGGRDAIDGQHTTWGVMALHDAVRFGCPDLVADALTAAVAETPGAHLLEAMADHGRSLVSHSADDLDLAARRFASCGAWILAAETAAQRAVILQGAGDTAQSARAVAMSLAWESRCQSASTPALAARPRTISHRAMEIASDAVRGTASADIAERRFISVRTVDNHLGAVYRALEVDGRNELTELLGPHLATE